MSIKQQQFSQYLRAPHSELTSLGREKIYYYLLRANLHELLSNIYPRLIQQLSDAQWTFFLDQFLQHHEAITPYFYQVPDEFLSFLWHNQALYADYPWLFTLAHFEWMELVVTVADVALPEQDATAVQCSPLAYSCQYDYAVYPLDKECTPLTRRLSPWHGIVYRNCQQQVRWVVLDSWSAGLFALIQQKIKISIDDIVAELMSRAPSCSAEDIYASVMAWCQEWKKLGILV